jgi:hypothetical protein
VHNIKIAIWHVNTFRFLNNTKIKKLKTPLCFKGGANKLIGSMSGRVYLWEGGL